MVRNMVLWSDGTTGPRDRAPPGQLGSKISETLSLAPMTALNFRVFSLSTYALYNAVNAQEAGDGQAKIECGVFPDSRNVVFISPDCRFLIVSKSSDRAARAVVRNQDNSRYLVLIFSSYPVSRRRIYERWAFGRLMKWSRVMSTYDPPMTGRNPAASNRDKLD